MEDLIINPKDKVKFISENNYVFNSHTREPYLNKVNTIKSLYNSLHEKCSPSTAEYFTIEEDNQENLWQYDDIDVIVSKYTPKFKK